ncbi:MAG TPA: sugar phosphate isomerase/epimerase [Opitutaceae bacterium]|nr:sugar phosphate isomerase/epimerase [Opitutaceae bacterium]
MNTPLLPRRTFLASLAATVPLALVACRKDTPATPPAAPPPKSGAALFKLGVASISLRQLAVPEVITVLKQLEIGFVSIHGAHASFEKDTPEKCAGVAKAFRDAGIEVATSSVVNLPNDEAAVRRAFDNARAGGLTLMTCKPALDAFPLLERFVKETGIRLAVHNHGPEDKVYPSPYDVLKAIEPFDARIGLCLDVGHTVRAGVDPAKVIREAASRLYDVHLKDSIALPGALTDIPTEVGRGRIDIKAVIAALIETKYAGVAAFEYERVGVNPVIGLAESVGHVRGLLRAES